MRRVPVSHFGFAVRCVCDNLPVNGSLRSEGGSVAGRQPATAITAAAMRRVALALLAAAGLAGFVSAADAARLIVAFESEGPHALESCAEGLQKSGAAFASATADASASLDSLRARHRVTAVRALFRSSDGRPLAMQRRALRERILRASAGSGSAVRVGAGRAEVPDLGHVYVVEWAGDAAVDDMVAEFAADPHVAWAQADHEHALDAAPSDDPYLSSAGSWGQPYADMWALERIRAQDAWVWTRGEGVVVAVVDTGLDPLHPDISDNVWVNPGEDLDGNGRVDPGDWNGVDDDGNGFVDDLRGFDFANSVDADGDGRYDGPEDVSDADPFDDNGHGTHVAGTIAAIAGNGIGIAGVAPAVKLMPLKGFGASGSAQASTLWRAVLYAILSGADVINNSWSCFPACPSNPLGEEMARLARKMGVVIVTSAGNRQSDVIENSPENGPDVITVAATGQDDDLSRSITNFGWMIDVSAPGGGPSSPPGVRVARRNILSLRSSAIADDDPFSVGHDYYRWAGTSMAAPHVSGVVALLKSAYPDLTYRDVRRVLRQSAVDLGAPGHDREFGAGRLDALAAVNRPPLPDLEVALESPAQRSVFGWEDEDVGVFGTAVGADLVDWELSVGRGNVPTQWIRIADASRGPVENGLLGTWFVADFEEGTWVLRLRAIAADGSVYSEYLQTSIERNVSQTISSEGPDAERPDVDGDFVVWQSRREPDAPAERAASLNVFVSRISTRDEWPIAASPLDEHSPTISDGVVAWLEADTEAGTSRVAGCVIDPVYADCRPYSTPSSDTVFVAPASAAGRVFWLEAGPAGPDLRGCRPDADAGTCVEYDLALEPAARGFPGSDGETLTWLEGGPSPRHGACRIDRRSGACVARYPEQSIRAVSRPAASKDRIAWVGFSVSRRNPLFVCERDDESGACPALRVDEFVTDTTPRLSGRRMVWERIVGDEARDVFFCEVDGLVGRCPIQRITAELSEQSDADIDGRRVVWADRRDGGARIRTRRLPEVGRLHDRTVRVGRRLRVPVRAVEGEGAEIHLAAEVGGRPASELGIGLVERSSRPGRARGWLVWRPSAEHVGQYVVTVKGTNAAGWVTRRSFRITVEAREHSGIRRRVRGQAEWLAPWLARLWRD